MRERSSRPGRLYAAIPNEAMRDASVSMEARGLLALLMTYSDEWVFRKDHLLETTGWGRDKFERHMGELIAAGYVERVQTREEGTGKLLGSSWIIRDDRCPENQGVGVTDALKNRPTVKPTHGESAPIRNNKREEDQKGRIHSEDEPFLFSAMDQPESKVETSDRFEEFWKVYPKKDGKKKARENFARAVKRGADPDEIIAGARRYADACVGTEPHFVKWAQGWLTDERWTDLPEPAQAPDGHRISAPWGEVVR
jgi:hypothetical protein